MVSWIDPKCIALSGGAGLRLGLSHNLAVKYVGNEVTSLKAPFLRGWAPSVPELSAAASRVSVAAIGL